MYFRKSADIVKAHQTLAKEVEQVDDLIYTIGDHPIRADQVSDNLGIDETLLLRILGLYVTADILRCEKRRYCRRLRIAYRRGKRHRRSATIAKPSFRR